jgi:hypothetical protein
VSPDRGWQAEHNANLEQITDALEAAGAPFCGLAERGGSED